MAKDKFYAVKVGRIPGIYLSWNVCEAQVKGFPNAQYKSFSTEKEAVSYMQGAKKHLIEPIKAVQKKVTPSDDMLLYDGKPYAFVDGSYNTETQVYGYGGFLYANGQRFILQGSGNDPALVGMRNVAGELAGAQAAVNKALELGLTEMNLCYDYNGIADWASGKWRTKMDATRDYANKMRKLSANGLRVNFVKIKGHSGVPGNELADKLAKQSVGLISNDEGQYSTPLADRLSAAEKTANQRNETRSDKSTQKHSQERDI